MARMTSMAVFLEAVCPDQQIASYGEPAAARWAVKPSRLRLIAIPHPIMPSGVEGSTSAENGDRQAEILRLRSE